MKECNFYCPNCECEQTAENLPSGYEAMLLNHWINQDLIKICRAVDRWAAEARIIEINEERNT